MALLQNASDDILSVASSTLCNLLLEFSPSKEPILESGAVDLLCTLTRRPDPALRLNGIWALMVSISITGVLGLFYSALGILKKLCEMNYSIMFYGDKYHKKN